MTLKIESYDIVFAGWGASACILLIQMEKKDLLKGKRVLLIDPDEKKENDKTFCFWATDHDDIYHDYSKIVSANWSNIQINNSTPESIRPLQYFHINSLDLYNYAKQISSKHNIRLVKDYVLHVEEKETFYLETKNTTYQSKYIFDSRTPKIKMPNPGRYYIYQSFYGLKIELIEQFFDDDVCTLMDFRISQNGATQFVYILPYSKNKALVEITRFGKKIIEINEAKKLLNNYITDNFGPFNIMEKERGLIPMDPILPKQSKRETWTFIGTRAGNVKPSTGYAFKNMYNQSVEICNSDSFKPKTQLRKRRFHFYDQLLLIILTLWPDKGKFIFERLFKVKSAGFVLNFLDEKSKPIQEFKMFFKLQIGVFLKATLYWISWRLKKYLIYFLMIFLILIPSKSVESDDLRISIFQTAILVIGLLVIGIPHGALDHFTNAIDKGKKITFKFVSRYMILMVPVFFLWIWSPSFALISFLIYSAWHFGQTDVEQWGIKSKIVGFLWGLILLTYLFVTHLKELNLILSALDVPLVSFFPEIEFLSFLILAGALSFAVFYRKLDWTLIIVFLFLSQFTNLIFAFGLYFIFHHSRLGWLHLKSKLQVSHIKMYLKALPFNIGAVVLFFVFFSNVDLSLKENIAYFFIFLSCVSFPHVLCMDVFYRKSA